MRVRLPRAMCDTRYDYILTSYALKAVQERMCHSLWKINPKNLKRYNRKFSLATLTDTERS